MRLVAETTTAANVADVELHTRILAFLGNTPGMPGSKVAEGIRAKKGGDAGGTAGTPDGGQGGSIEKGRAVRWFVTGSVTAE